MIWNWQLADWPHFTYNASQLDAFEKRLLLSAGVSFGAVKHLSEDDRRQLTIELISNEALKTSAIEGEYLNRDSLQSSICRQFGLITDHRKVPPAEQGIAEVMVDLYQHFVMPITHDQLYRWHTWITAGRHDLQDVGRYRTHDDPMQIVSGPVYAPKVHFEAPPSNQMTREMDQFIDWFNCTAPDGKTPLPALQRAGIAHLYFVSIHPFEDGNGRIGRVIAEKALAQCLGQPTLIALAFTIERQRNAYYTALEKANKQIDVTDWLLYFAELVMAAQDYTHQWIDFLIQKTKLYDQLRGQLNSRQEKALSRMFREGPDGFTGGLSADKYRSITGATSATATRDLQDLVTKSGLIRTGERKHTRYYLNLADSFSQNSQGTL
jgi:Fic family protein